MALRLIGFVPLFFCSCSLIIPVFSLDPFLGLHPLDVKYFVTEGVMKCKDGSRSFSRDRVNDDFCDCVDGTDEPGTSACPKGKFYCKNVGSTPRFLFTSRVNDQICDCCDGSDEYDGNINCPNTCIMGGNIVYKVGSYSSKVSSLRDSIKDKDTKSKVTLEDMLQKLKGKWKWSKTKLLRFDHTAAAPTGGGGALLLPLPTDAPLLVVPCY